MKKDWHKAGLTLQAKLCAVCLDQTVILFSDKMRVYLLCESWLNGKFWLCHEFPFLVHFHTLSEKQLNIWCWTLLLMIHRSISAVFLCLGSAVTCSVGVNSILIPEHNAQCCMEKMWNQNCSFSSLPELTPTSLTCLILVFLCRPSQVTYCCFVADS